MQKLHFSIVIKSPKEKVWETMLNQETYRAWTAAFHPGSYYVGDWSEGSKILFLAPEENGKTSGMVGRIRVIKKLEYVSIEMLGEVQDDVEDTTSEKVKKWSGTQENYTFRELNGTTEVQVDVDTPEEYLEMMRNSWIVALQKLKDLAENNEKMEEELMWDEDLICC